MSQLKLLIDSERAISLCHSLDVALQEACLLAGQDGMVEYIDDLDYLHTKLKELIHDNNTDCQQTQD